MKKMFVILSVVMMSVCAYSQSYERSGNTFRFVKTERADSTTATKTKFKWEDSKGKTYDVYMSKSYSLYINKVSKAGKPYKQYLPKEAQEAMRKELGVSKESK